MYAYPSTFDYLFTNMWLSLSFLLINFAVCSKLEKSEPNIYPLISNNVQYSNNELCKNHSELYMKQLENLTLWAHEMWDATAKYSTGILKGSTYQMGNWEECIYVDGPFKTQYCLANIAINIPNLNSSVHKLPRSPYENVFNRIYKTGDFTEKDRLATKMAICTSAACSPSDIEAFLNEYLKRIDNPFADKNVSYRATVQEKFCQTKDDTRYFDGVDIGFTCVLFLIIFLVSSATIYDIYEIKEEKPDYPKPWYVEMSQALSAKRNFLHLAVAHDSEPAFAVFRGIRCFCAFYIILGHRFVGSLMAPVMNLDYVEKQYTLPYGAYLYRSELVVDTFFVLGGILATYFLLVHFKKKVANPFLIVLGRYVRLVPPLAFTILCVSSIATHIFSGPFWKDYLQERDNCRNNWWLTLLFLSNYINDDRMCMVQTWFIQCDFHFFIMCLIVTMLLHRNKQLGLGVLTFLFILSIIVPFVLTVVYVKPAIYKFLPDTVRNIVSHPDFRFIYTKSHFRAASYILGMFGGYIYFRLRNSTKRLSKIQSHFVTFMALVLVQGSMLSGYLFNDRYGEHNVIIAGIYAALFRVGWSFGILCLLFSTSHGHATFLKSFFSWSPWIYLEKLVYCVYLTHLFMVFETVISTMAPIYINYFGLIKASLSDILLSFVIGLFLYLAVEAPANNLFKILLSSATSYGRIKSADELKRNTVV